MNDRDIVILFGAGASYGAGHVLPQATPLGADLYDALAVQYPREWGSASHLGKMWGTQFRADFERTMGEEVLPWVSSLTLLEWHRRVAEFFARYRLEDGGLDMLLAAALSAADERSPGARHGGFAELRLPA